ncbi:MAG TPA: TfoX/Sxy family protein [Thermoanaerobaculia bacterium]|nr:TfoX/Sxy family protein [Thermoanaerobaculia bacterium]
MPVSREYREFVLDQLRAVVPVSAKAMFGGVGIYSGGTFFALIADDVVYFKTDETTRGAYEAAGSKAFNPFGKGTMSYWELPADVLENEDELREWTRAALKVARKK